MMKECVKMMPVLVLVSVMSIHCNNDGVTPPADNKADTTSHVFSWTADTIGIYPSYLHGIWGTDVNNLYAVGFIELSDSPYTYTAIMHWDGVSWSSANYLEGFLEGIYGFNANDIWAVGSWSIGYDVYSLIAHWDGSSWKTWKPQQFGQLWAIWGTNNSNLFACGSGGLILHFDGTQWVQQQSGTTLNLRDIWGIDNTHIFAAGYESSTAEGTLLEYDGNSWKTITKGDINPDTTSLYGEFESIWANATNKLVLVGDLCYEGTPGEWRLSDIPNNSPGQNLTGLAAMNLVRGTLSNNVFICGDRDLIIHWNGSSWHIYNQFFDKSKQSRLTGIWMKDNNVFIAGYENGQAQAIVYRGTQ